MTGRCVHALELNPAYVDVAVIRWQSFTGKTATPGGDRRELHDDAGGEIRWFRFVRHGDRAGFEAQGWVFAADLGPVHGCYSILMELR